jgi:hypothetical protein
MRLRRAVDTAWTVYRATHDDVHELDERRCLLERHLQQMLQARETDAEEVTNAGLACAGLAYLERLPTEAWSE